MVSDQQSSTKCVGSQKMQGGLAAAKLKQVPSSDTTCTQLLTTSTDHTQVTASMSIASSNLRPRSLASSSDHIDECNHKLLLRRSDVCVGG
ncbi:hypothetical protein ACOSQ4_031950 [Xanthoceras sorbifolium]